MIAHLFHRLNRVIPEEQQLLVVSPTTSAREALQLMEQHKYSQLPVLAGNEVLGVFSYRSFARGVSGMTNKAKVDPLDLPVDDFIEQLQFASFTDDFPLLLNSLSQFDAVLIGQSDRLRGVVTPMDILAYLHRLASPFVLLAEIETCLRQLIRAAVDGQALANCIRVSLTQHYETRSLPSTLEEMSFSDYVNIIGDGRNWAPHFQPIFGGVRERTRSRLEAIRDVRNTVFHFRRDLTDEERASLQDSREWILRKARTTDATKRGSDRG